MSMDLKPDTGTTGLVSLLKETIDFGFEILIDQSISLVEVHIASATKSTTLCSGLGCKELSG